MICDVALAGCPQVLARPALLALAVAILSEGVRKTTTIPKLATRPALGASCHFASRVP